MRADYLKGLTTEYEAFNMDDLGNRMGNQTLRGDGSVNFAVDALTNRYTSVGGNSLAYDDAGNLTQDKDGYRFTYDHENRIIEVRNSSDSLVAQMDYDSQGRRIKVYDAVADTTTLYYYSDNWQVLSQYTGGTLDKSFFFGNYIDEVLVMLGDTSTYFYLHDHLYSPVALINPAGTVVERYEYDAYGKASILASDFSPLSSSGYGNRILFTGREVDYLDNGSLPLQYNRHRYLSQYMGRWYSHDPFGIDPTSMTSNVFKPLIQFTGGLNLYQYVRSTPLLYSDPFGLIEDRPGRRHTNVRSSKPISLDGYIRDRITGPFSINAFTQEIRYEAMQYIVEFKIGCDAKMLPFIGTPAIAEYNRVNDIDSIGMKLKNGFSIGLTFYAEIDNNKSRAYPGEIGKCRGQYYKVTVNFNASAGIRWSQDPGRFEDFIQDTVTIGSKTYLLHARCCCRDESGD